MQIKNSSIEDLSKNYKKHVTYGKNIFVGNISTKKIKYKMKLLVCGEPVYRKKYNRTFLKKIPKYLRPIIKNKV